MTTKPTITELAKQLDDVLTAHDLADRQTIAAYHAKDDAEHEQKQQEQERLSSEKNALARAILEAPALTVVEAVVQLTVAQHPIGLIVDDWGGKRKKAARAATALASALAVLIEVPGVAVPEWVHRYYRRRSTTEDDPSAERRPAAASVERRAEATAPDDLVFKAENQIEDAFSSILGVSHVFRNLKHESQIDADETLPYLANQLEDHQAEGLAALCRLFGRNEHSKQQGGPGPLIAPIAGNGVSADRRGRRDRAGYTPHLTLAELWEKRTSLDGAIEKYHDDHPDFHDDDIEPLYKQRDEIEDEVAGRVAGNPADLLAQLLLLKNWTVDREVDFMHERFVANLIAGAERLAGGAA